MHTEMGQMEHTEASRHHAGPCGVFLVQVYVAEYNQGYLQHRSENDQIILGKEIKINFSYLIFFPEYTLQKAAHKTTIKFFAAPINISIKK
jgi:hypothetical protein